ncbi:MAG: HAD-IA family hydrolase [Alcanivoracaceae bacterium]|jgi:putative hydrolase of the HAD superfamily|nr:HAD-IA family hydrolase [Alcanivoracaceae bacterium]
MTITTLFWDFGGVVADSPFDNLARYERENDLPMDFLRLTNAQNADTNAWACFERGDIDVETFDRRFAEETAARGHRVPGRDLLPLLQVAVRPRMVEVIRSLASRYRQACLTNNLPVGQGAAMSQDGAHGAAAAEALALFDFVLESSKAGARKPEPAFFQRACEMAAVSPQQVLFLDDLGINLKPARAMGMTTIKVTGEQQAVEALQETLGHPVPLP